MRGSAGGQYPLISVVVPIYNVEEYLPRCLDSLVAQQYRPIELVLVDDGSPDNSAAIMARYAATYDFIRTVHQQNAGLGGARNTGIERATGEFIAFVDSDDYVEPNYLSRMAKVMRRHNADVAICSFSVDLPGGLQVPFPLMTARRDYTGTRAGQKTLDLLTIPTFAWNKLFRRSLFVDNDVRFPSIYYEDVATVARVLSRADRVVVTHRALYHYCLRRTGITGNFGPRNVRDYLHAVEIIRDFIWNNGLWEEWYRPYQRFRRHVRAQLDVSIALVTELSLDERRDRIVAARRQLKRLKLPPDHPPQPSPAGSVTPAEQTDENVEVTPVLPA